MKHAAKPIVSNPEVGNVDELITPYAGPTPNNVVGCSKIVAEEYLIIIIDIIRSKEVITCVFVRDFINHGDEILVFICWRNIFGLCYG